MKNRERNQRTNHELPCHGLVVLFSRLIFLFFETSSLTYRLYHKLNCHCRYKSVKKTEQKILKTKQANSKSRIINLKPGDALWFTVMKWGGENESLRRPCEQRSRVTLSGGGRRDDATRCYLACHGR